MRDDKKPKKTTYDDVYPLSDGLVVKIGGTLHTLNETAVEILELCDNNHTVSDIVDEMNGRYQGLDVTEFVNNFIDQLLEKKIIAI